MTSAHPSDSSVAATLERSAWFCAAPPALRAQLLELGRTRCLAAGERLFSRGAPDDGLYCVLDGLIRIGAASMAGKEALLALIEPVNWFGEIALFDEGARTHDAHAERASTLFHVPRAALVA
jgi:CRP-like cAMP-binding protein